MGWNPFASEEVTQVGTQVMRVINDASLPDSIQSGSIKAFFHEGNVSDYVLEDLSKSIGARAEKMYRYAESNYTYGLPSGEIYSSTQGADQVEAQIELQEGKQVLIKYSHYGTANALHIGWMKLIASHGYNPDTNLLGTLTTTKGKSVYLSDMVVVVPQTLLANTPAGRIVQWGSAARSGYTPDRPASAAFANVTTPSAVQVSDTGTEVKLLVTYCWEELGQYNGTTYGTFEITLAGYDLTANYFHAKYVVDGHIKYWVYRKGQNTVAALENVYTEQPAVSGSYFPFSYFRYGKASQLTDKNSDGYKTTKRMLKQLGMDYDTVATGIDENPSIGDVEQALMIFAVPPTSSNAADNEYLFRYFDVMYEAMDGSGSLAENDLLRTQYGLRKQGNWSTDYQSVVIQDKRFKMVFGVNGIYKQLVAGSIGAVDSYTSELIQVPTPVTYSDGEGVSYTNIENVATYRYRHQIAEGLYEELTVTNMRMTYYIYGGYATVGNNTNTYLLVPLDYTITKTMPLRQREQLYARSLHFVFNSRTTVEVEWYQQEWFGIFLIVLAVVLTIADGGTDGGSWIATALGVTGVEAVIVTVIFNVLVSMYIMPELFKIFVKAFGKDAATILAIVLIAWGAYELGTNGVKGAPFAQDMLMLSTGLQRAVMVENYKDLLDESSNFREYADAKQESLDAANKLLETSTVLSPFVIFGEKPEDFYNRTIHFGNIGTLGITAISSYVDIALTLPKIYDTLGDPNNG